MGIIGLTDARKKQIRISFSAVCRSIRENNLRVYNKQGKVQSIIYTRMRSQFNDSFHKTADIYQRANAAHKTKTPSQIRPGPERRLWTPDVGAPPLRKFFHAATVADGATSVDCVAPTPRNILLATRGTSSATSGSSPPSTAS